MKKYTVTLTKGERCFWAGLSPKGKHKSEKVINSLILQGCDEGGLIHPTDYSKNNRSIDSV